MSNIYACHPIVLFDGVCNLCNGVINFIIENDKQSKFRFASLQSTESVKILKSYGINDTTLNSVVLVYQNKIYTQSSAALHILKLLGGIYSVGYLFILIPSFIRNWIYQLIAKNRYKWFGKKDNCMVPSESVKKLFLI